MMFVDWNGPYDEDLDVGQPVAQPRFGDEGEWPMDVEQPAAQPPGGDE